MSVTKVKLEINGNSFEIEGSEQFVAEHLEEFKQLMAQSPAKANEPKVAPKGSPKPKKAAKPMKAPKVVGNDETAKKSPRSKAKSKKVSAERFDIHGDTDKQSLKEFFASKNPGAANGPAIAVIGYYITEILGQDSFSEGQVEYAYKMLGLKRPNHLRQIMINNKNDKDWYEPLEGEGKESSWQLTRSGELFVSDNLPAGDK